MFSQEESDEITKILADTGNTRSASHEILLFIQSVRGWISDESLHDAATVLNMHVSELEDCATYYTKLFRKPIGAYVIRVCDSASCWICGCESIFEYLKQQLGIHCGQTTADGMFTLLPTCCIGACDQAPVLSCNGEMHFSMTKEKIDDLLESCRKSYNILPDRENNG